MFEKAYNKTDFVLHLDADDYLCGNFDKNLLETAEGDSFYLNYKRGSSNFVCTSIYNNRLIWKYVGVAHNIIVCLDKKDISSPSNHFINSDLWVDNNERGSRMMDPNKYLKDAELLQKQFFDTLYEDPYNINNRSVFYTAQSYFDFNDYINSIKWYKLYTKLKNTWNEEEFESYLRLARCRIKLEHSEKLILEEINKAIRLFVDRAEPYFIIADYYFYKKDYEKAYEYYKKCKGCDYNKSKEKYLLFINFYNYGKHINDCMAVACCYSDRAVEACKLVEEIIDDDDFKDHKDRLTKNLIRYFLYIYNLYIYIIWLAQDFIMTHVEQKNSYNKQLIRVGG